MDCGGVLDYIFGGWNVTWVQTYQSGLPATFTMLGSPYNYLAGNERSNGPRPNQILPNSQVTVPNWSIGDRFATSIENPIWNINAFAYPAAFTAGSLGPQHSYRPPPGRRRRLRSRSGSGNSRRSNFATTSTTFSKTRIS